MGIMPTPIEATMAVYIIRAGEFVKIGYASDPIERIKGFQTASPENIEILAIYTGFEGSERALQRRFAKDRYRGEWFWYSDDVKAYIAHHRSDPGVEFSGRLPKKKRNMWMEFKRTGKKWLARFRWRNPDGSKSRPVRVNALPPMSDEELDSFRIRRDRCRVALSSKKGK